jgi:AraC family transcriptional regulator
MNATLSLTEAAPPVSCSSSIHAHEPATPPESVADEEPPSLERLKLAVTELLHALGNSLQEEHESAQQCMRSAAAALRVKYNMGEPVTDTVPSASFANRFRGGLAPWQKRVVQTHIETHLDWTIQTKHLAQLVNLSPFHFCRTFRDSFGLSPHQYVMRKRLERAQGLMLTTSASLSQIAADCGLADQAHLTKQFRKLVGESPAVWRRARLSTPMQQSAR